MAGARAPGHGCGMNFSPFVFLAPVLAAAAFAAPASANVYCVHTSGTCEPGTVDRGADLALALDDAEASLEGDVIRVGPGQYSGAFTYSGAGALQIVGAGRGLTTLAGPAGPADVVLRSGRADVSHLRVLLPATPDWVGVLASGDAVISDVAIDGAPGASDRLGAALHRDASLVGSTVSLGADEVGVETHSDGETPSIVDSTIEAATGIQALPENGGRTIVRRSTVDGFVPLLAQGTEMEADNVVALAGAGAAAAVVAECGQGPVHFTGDHLTIDGRGANAGVLALCEVDNQASTVALANSIVTGATHGFDRHGGKGRTANVSFRFSDVRNVAGSPEIGAGDLFLIDLLDVDPGFAADGIRLAPGSPLVDAGDPAAPEQALDRDRHPRLVGPRRDIGAFELQPAEDEPQRIPVQEWNKPGEPEHPPFVVPSGEPSIVSDAALLAELRRTIARRPGRAGRTRYAHRFLVPGTLVLRWTKGRSVIARAKVVRSAPGRVVFRVKPTAKGRRLLRRGARVRLAVRAAFAPNGRATLKASRRATLRKRA